MPIMKRLLHSSFLIAASLLFQLGGNAQSEVYFREGFNEGEGELPSSAAAVYPGGYVLQTNSGTWYTHGAYRTNGATGACPTQTGGPSHVRFANLNNVTTPPTSGTDSAYLVTPVVNFGINTISFLNGRAGRRLTIEKTTDTLATTANWTFVEFLPATNAACDMFTVTVNDPAARRLRLVARAGTDTDLDSIVLTSTSPILPVSFGSFNAIEQSGKIKLSWRILTEENTDRYEIERSANGTSFTTIGQVAASKLEGYSWLDNSPLNGVSFYRIKAVDKDASAMYSSVIRMKLQTTSFEVAVSPNPVKGGRVNLQISNPTKGNYTVTLFNAVGQVVFTRNLEVNGSTVIPMNLPASVKSGIYNLQLRNGAEVVSKKLVVE
jgi:hypothetical protein